MYKFQSSTCKTVGEKLRTKLCLRTDGQPWRFQYTPLHFLVGVSRYLFVNWRGHQTSPTVLSLTHSHTTTPFDAPWKQAFWKHWDMEKLLVTKISPFPKVLSKGLFPRGVKMCHCVGKGEALFDSKFITATKFICASEIIEKGRKKVKIFLLSISPFLATFFTFTNTSDC